MTGERRKEMTVREAGRKGGETTAGRHGRSFYETIGKKGGEARKRALGHDGYKELGREGGRKVRELIEKGKRAG
jgi:general stress protein YciG